MPSLIFRKGLDLKDAVAGRLAENYHSAIVERIKAEDYTYRSGRLTIHLAREFGFCYGVDRAVDYAYQTRERFPDRAVHLTGEIIHNPHVNEQLRSMGIGFLSDDDAAPASASGPSDVVILPAFGVTVRMLQQLERRGCTLIDTTCGSVLNVWKNVRRYCEGGYTSIIHGKAWHEETQATASQAVAYGGRYLVVLNHEEAQIVLRLHPRRRRSRRVPGPLRQVGLATASIPIAICCRVGLANQTTMLMSESLEIGEMLKAAMLARYGAPALAAHFQAFDTICSATQDRQDAVVALLDQHAGGPDAGHWRLQQQQYLQPGAHLRRVAADVSHCRPDMPGFSN